MEEGMRGNKKIKAQWRKGISKFHSWTGNSLGAPRGRTNPAKVGGKGWVFFMNPLLGGVRGGLKTKII